MLSTQQQHNNNQKSRSTLWTQTLGFTLIELMVVVTIIGVIMSAGITTYTQTQKQSRDARRRADVKAFSQAIEQYYLDNGQYPNLYGVSNSTSWQSGAELRIGSFFPNFASSLDPINNDTYRYILLSTQRNRSYSGVPAVNPQTRYCVYARLEVENGNCTGYISDDAISHPSGMMCNFVTPGTGRAFCIQALQ